MAKNKRKMLDYKALVDYLSYPEYRVNDDLEQLYTNLNIEDVRDSYALSTMQSKVEELIDKINFQIDLYDLIRNYDFKLKYLKQSIKEAFDRKSEELYKIEDEPEDTYSFDDDYDFDDPFASTPSYSSRRNTSSRTSRSRRGISISNPFAGLRENRKREKLPLCTYDPFMDVLEDVRRERPDSTTLNSLFYTLDLKDRSEYIGSRNRINSYLRRSETFLRRAFNKLTREEMYALSDAVEQKYRRKLDKNEIIKEYINKLKAFCKEPSKGYTSSHRNNYGDGYDYDYDDTFSSGRTLDDDDTLDIVSTPTKTTNYGQRRNMPACTYDQFIDALDEVRMQRPNSSGLSNLYYSLSVEGRDYIGRRNQINSYLTRNKASVRKAFNKLSREELGAIVSLVEQKFNRKFDEGVIVAGFGDALKAKCKEYRVGTTSQTYDYSSQGMGYMSGAVPSRGTTLDSDYGYGTVSIPPERKFKNYPVGSFEIPQPEEETYYYGASQVRTGTKFKPVGPTGKFIAGERENNPYAGRVSQIVIPKDYKFKYLHVIAPSYGETVIGFIDRKFNKQILEKFDEEFITINPFKEDFIAKSNKLIEAIVSDAFDYDSEEDKQKMIAAVKDNYGLELSPIKYPEEVLRELVADELRFYQQKVIEKKLDKIDTTFLGTSKRISKDICQQRLVLEDLRTFAIPGYAFSESAIENGLDIVTGRKKLPKDYASRYLTGGFFGEETARVIITKNEDGTYRVSNAVSTLKY